LVIRLQMGNTLLL